MSPQSLHLAPRKFDAALGLGVALVTIAGSLYPLPFLAAWLFPERAWVAVAMTTLPGLALGISIAVPCWRRWTMRGPALVFGDAGLTDHRKAGLCIGWNEIESMRLDTRSEDDRIVIRLRQSGAAKSGLRRIAKAMARLLRGGDVVIGLGDVKYDIKILERTIAVYTARSIASG